MDTHPSISLTVSVCMVLAMDGGAGDRPTGRSVSEFTHMDTILGGLEKGN